MAGKGNRRHIKRLASSKYMQIQRQRAAYIAKPLPGAHTAISSISLVSVLRDKLHAVASSAEAKSVIGSGSIEVNGRVVREERYAVGFSDIIHLKPESEYYKVVINHASSFALDKCGKDEKRVLKITGKYTLRGGRLMLRLMNGSVVSAGEGMSVNDSVVVSSGSPEKVIKMEKGSKCLVISGTHASEYGIIKELVSGTASRLALAKVSGTSEFETPLRNIMAVE